MLKGYIGIVLFNIPENASTSDEDPRPPLQDEDLPKLFYKYPVEQQKIISDIFDKFQFNEKNRVTVNHTYLYLKNGIIVSVFRQKCKDKILFFDIFGRVYQSWEHFRDTNRLPCQYLAPVDGIHKTNQQLSIYQPVKPSMFSRVIEASLIGCTIVALSLAFVSMPFAAPAAMVCGVLSTAYCIGKCTNTLSDRYNHQQSIGLDNTESVVCWFTIGTCAITAISSLGTSYAAQIIQKAGSFGKAAQVGLKVLNATSLAANLSNFGVHFYYLHQKRLKGEELTISDALGVCVNLFLTYGAVCKTREMFNFIDNLEVKLVSNECNFQKIFPGVDGNITEVDVTNVNLFDVHFDFVLNAAKGVVLKHFNEETRRIYEQSIAVGQACVDFNKNNINVLEFCNTLQKHLMNFCTLINIDNSTEKKSVEPHLKAYLGNNVPQELTGQVSQVVKNVTADVKKIDEKYLRNLRSEINSKNDNINRFTRNKYEIILQVAKNNIPQTIQPNEILKIFVKKLLYLIGKIESKLNENYKEYVSKNEAFLCSETKAKELFSKMGLNSKNDFANQNFHSVMKSISNEIQSVDHSPENEQIMEKLFALYNELFFTNNSQGRSFNELDILATCDVLKKSATVVLQRLNETFTACNKLYDVNFPFLGQQAAVNMVLNALNVQPNRSDLAANSPSSIFFEVASEKLDFNEIISELETMGNGNQNSAQPINNDGVLSDAKIRSTLLSLCDKFLRKVEPKLTMKDDNERAERLKHIHYYFLTNFVILFQEMENEKNSKIPELLKLNEPFFDQRQIMLNRLVRVVRVTNKSEIFASVEKHFGDEKSMEALVEKYISTCHDIDDFHIEMYKCNGIRQFSIYKGAGVLTEQDYKLKAIRLFNLNENEIELIKIEEKMAILKCNNFFVTFLTTDDNSLIATEIDTSIQLISQQA